ncbi:MAG: hypothetical protein PHV37_03700 [Candidatus Gastranaerophilales bacterium]|nr:hypothetical protein [Candidatus Gastranaerophilales bacterium]
MNNNLLLNNPSDNSKKAEKYIYKYLNELKIHFNLSDKCIIKILSKCLSNIKKTSMKESWWKKAFQKTEE